MIFQEPMTSLNPAYTIGNQLTEALRRHKKVSAAEARDRAIYLLEKVGITAAASRLTQYPHQLSGGLRQRVMIAMALMCGPEMIIADEPTTALDVTIQGQILYEAQKLCRETGTALIWITHDLAVVAGLADKISVMYAGRVVEQGGLGDVLDNPGHPYTQGLLGSVPGHNTRGKRLYQIPGMTPSLLKLPAGCAFKDRCPHADAACDTRPDITQPIPGRALRCVHPQLDAGATAP